MNKLSSLIAVALGALAACSNSGQAGSNSDASEGGPFGGSMYLDAVTPIGPDLSCLSQPINPPPPTAVNQMVLAGKVVEYTTAGITPVDAADVARFRAGQPIVLARTHSASNGAFATGSLTTNGHAADAYIKATKSGYRTAFYYPPFPTSTVVAPGV